MLPATYYPVACSPVCWTERGSSDCGKSFGPRGSLSRELPPAPNLMLEPGAGETLNTSSSVLTCVGVIKVNGSRGRPRPRPRPLSPSPLLFQRHWGMREGSFIGSLVLLISSLITGHYSGCVIYPLGHDALRHSVSHKQAAARWLDVGGAHLCTGSQTNGSEHVLTPTGRRFCFRERLRGLRAFDSTRCVKIRSLMKQKVSGRWVRRWDLAWRQLRVAMTPDLPWRVWNTKYPASESQARVLELFFYKWDRFEDQHIR